MAVTAEITESPPDWDVEVPDVPIYRLSIEQYHAMARVGILDEDAPVELLEGWLVQKMTKYPAHRVTTHRVRRALERLIVAGWYVDSQEPITLAAGEPEPDVVVVRGQTEEYLDRHPGPREVGLVVEVADASLRIDRGAKKRSYAAAEIPIYWIVNLKAGQIEVYTEPDSAAKRPDYRQRSNYGPEDEIPIVLDGVQVGRLAVRELLP
jgi:Uma2 family endonuclease